ncbi:MULTISPECIES: ABC transporter permease [Chryseobacterium]|uniref:ABC-2 family transporter protein n=1 Tax=Chryseobacterium indoltheticum TaxID=254 RepID=A0A381FC92_9FLAO|nr:MULTISPECIES: ABC transporter permease subunit [Chryseobacterium]AZA73828.1 ABC transporter permease [Chryseobacterium indoltheticum]MDF2833557.1 transporter permease [Chryseobacterium indoltheticum]MDQ8143681.1 ABC transporter permease subunit [Chryseobacterium sp. CFS15]SIQ96717.1 ABC-2 family transporter protein [Chryseobacterium indoltheticum]SUX44103.1 ABC-type transport system involved in multi-copper enzyme maturation, permease component [Chryseobacterium indoltheticum]
MMKLLKLEYYKNLNYTPFKVFTILYFAILVIFLCIGLIDLKLFGDTINLKEQGMYNFPEIWNFTTWTVALLKIFLGLIIVFSICQEFSNRMFKQNTIDGLSREEFIGSKLLTITIFTLISTIIVFAITLFLGLQYSTSTESSLVYKEMFFIGNYFLKLFAFFCFLMFLSILLRKSVFVFLAFFVIWVGESIIGGIESYSKLAGLKAAQRNEVLQNDFFFSKIFPLESMSNLIPNPMLRLNMAKALGLKYEFTYPTESLIACLIWCVLFIFGSYLILKKRDW